MLEHFTVSEEQYTHVSIFFFIYIFFYMDQFFTANWEWRHIEMPCTQYIHVHFNYSLQYTRFCWVNISLKNCPRHSLFSLIPTPLTVFIVPTLNTLEGIFNARSRKIRLHCRWLERPLKLVRISFLKIFSVVYIRFDLYFRPYDQTVQFIKNI